MADGQHDNLRIGAIIQARMSSTRLPGKILMALPFPSGRPLLGWVTEAIRHSRFINKTILATSTHDNNDPLEIFSKSEKIELMRGSEDDVLARFVEIIKIHKLDVVIRLTGDNPIVDIEILDEVIQFHLDQKNDYTKTSGLPIGMNFEVVSSKALVRQLEYNLTDADKEHVTLFIRRSANFKTGELKVFTKEEFGELRLTVDYPSDYAAMSIILSFVNEGDLPRLQLIREIRQTEGWIFEINSRNGQRSQFTTIADEIQSAISYLSINGMDNAASILKKYGAS